MERDTFSWISNTSSSVPEYFTSPNMGVGQRVDELGRNPQIVPGLPDTSLQYVSDIDRPGDLRNGLASCP